jgi:uncharacterized damage-inducible protein DinB
MSSLEIVRTMTDYNYTWQRKVWDSIMTLSDEQFLADIPYSHGSLRNHMVHLANTDSGWLRGLKGEPDARARRYNPEDYVVRESVRAICEQAAGEVTAYITALTEADLDHQPDGMPMTVGQTLLHLVNHGTDHRAQVLRALHDFGAPTFDQDLVFYFLGRQ